MSLSKSPTQPDASAVLRDAFVEVCQNSFFALAEACDAHRFAELSEQCSRVAREIMDHDRAQGARRQPASEWLKASVAFGGPIAGAIEVIMPERLARWLCASISGDPPDAPIAEHEIFDGLGEFANMICGAWLTDMYQRQMFELRPPAVTRMTPEWTPLTDSNWNDERGHRLVINDMPVRLRFRSMAG